MNARPHHPSFVLVAVLLAIGSSCGSQPATHVVTEAESTTEVAIATGDTLEVRLESNPATGYSWSVPQGGLPPMLDHTGSEFVMPDTDLVGAPGTEIHRFEAMEGGAGVLRLEYVRPFEDQPIPERVVEYIVRVDGAPWPPDPASLPPGTSTQTAPGG